VQAELLDGLLEIRDYAEDSEFVRAIAEELLKRFKIN